MSVWCVVVVVTFGWAGACSGQQARVQRPRGGGQREHFPSTPDRLRPAAAALPASHRRCMQPSLQALQVLLEPAAVPIGGRLRQQGPATTGLPTRPAHTQAGHASRHAAARHVQPGLGPPGPQGCCEHHTTAGAKVGSQDTRQHNVREVQWLTGGTGAGACLRNTHAHSPHRRCGGVPRRQQCTLHARLVKHLRRIAGQAPGQRAA